MIDKVEYQIWQAVYLVSSHALWRPKHNYIFFSMFDRHPGRFRPRLMFVSFQFHICVRASDVTPSSRVQRKLIGRIFCRNVEINNLPYEDSLFQFVHDLPLNQIFVYLPAVFILIRTHIQMYCSLVLFLALANLIRVSIVASRLYFLYRQTILFHQLG